MSKLMTMPVRKHPVITAISALISVLLIWGFWPQSVFVEAIEAKRAPLTITIEEEGRTRVVDRYIISAPVDGVACRQQMDVGDEVKRGQVLLGITPMESQILDPRTRAQTEAQVAAAESALHAAEQQAEAAQAAAKLAVIELERLKPLLDKGVVSTDAYDKAATQVETSAAAQRSADFQVEVARYELEAAKTVLEYRSAIGTEDRLAAQGEPAERIPVTSPVDGRVLKVTRECEGPVRTGDMLIEVGDPKVLEVEVDVLSADAVKIKPGMKVVFERWGGEQPLEGVVRLIEPVGFMKVSALGVEEQRVLIISDFTSPAEDWQRVGDGYRVEAKFILWHEDDVLQVPASSLFRYKDGWAVFVVNNHHAERRVVKVGQRNGLVAQIEEGISEGELVVNHPSDEVDDGRRVKLRL